MRRFLIATALFTLALPTMAQAQMDNPNILTLPAGQALLQISATEQMDVAQDLLVASLRYEMQGADAGKVQNEINTVMKKALEIVAKHTDIKAETGQYSIYQTTLPRTEEQVWQGTQGLDLKSTNTKDLLDLTGELQKLGLITGGLSYTISPARTAELQDSMMEAALAKLQTRANRAAKALGKQGAELIEVNVQGNYNPAPVSMYRGAYMEMASMKADAVAPPVAEAGETTLTLTVSAQALLKP